MTRPWSIPVVTWVLMAVGGCAGGASVGSSLPGQSGQGGTSNGFGGATETGVRDAGPATADGGVSRTGGFSILSGSGGSAAAGGAELAAGGSGTAAGEGGRTGSADAAGVGSPPPDAYVGCSVNIIPWSSASLLNLPSGSTSTLAVEGTIAWGSSTPTEPTWQWTVKGPDGTPLALTSVSTTDKNASIVQFPLLVPGSYDISASATSACKGHASATAVKPQDVSPQTFFIRVLPPPAASAGSGQTCDSGPARWCPSEDAVPYEDTNFVLQPGQPRQGDVQFLRGYAVSIDPVQIAQPDPTAFPAVAVPSYVRVSPQGSTWTFDGASTSDQPLRALLDPLHTYDILVIPQTELSTKVFPPFLVASKLAQEFRPDDFDVAEGVTIQGTLRGPDGPAAGARLLLRADATDPVTLPLPSTVGSADASGAYSLRASAGTLFSAVVVPPSDTSLPQVTIADCIDLQAIANGASLDPVDFAWNTISTTTITLRVLMSDNTTPAAGTAVRLQSQDGALPSPGVLTVAGGAWPGAASGSVRQEGTTDANGSIVFANLPKVAYDLTFTPPSTLAGAAITSQSIDLGKATSSSTRTLSLGNKVKLSGRLLPADAANGAQLVATDTGTSVLVSIISTTVASDGSYAFLADPGRTYRVSVEPAAGKNLPTRIPLFSVTTTDQDAPLGDRTLPAGLKVSGIVSFNGIPVAGAIVQAYCEQSTIPGCVDPNNLNVTLPPPLVEFATLPADGSYSFYLLDPATGG
jgi:hypothetical protein